MHRFNFTLLIALIVSSIVVDTVEAKPWNKGHHWTTDPIQSSDSNRAIVQRNIGGLGVGLASLYPTECAGGTINPACCESIAYFPPDFPDPTVPKYIQKIKTFTSSGVGNFHGEALLPSYCPSPTHAVVVTLEDLFALGGGAAFSIPGNGVVVANSFHAVLAPSGLISINSGIRPPYTPLV